MLLACSVLASREQQSHRAGCCASHGRPEAAGRSGGLLCCNLLHPTIRPPCLLPLLSSQVLAKLSETAEKGLLGGLKGAAGSWDKVVKAYEYNREPLAHQLISLCSLRKLAGWFSACSGPALPSPRALATRSYVATHCLASARSLRCACASTPLLHTLASLLAAAAPSVCLAVIFVAEAAQALCRNADYEIPFLKKQVAAACCPLPPAPFVWPPGLRHSGAAKQGPPSTRSRVPALPHPCVLHASFLPCPPAPQAAKYQQQLADLERRKADAQKSAAAAAADFQQARGQWLLCWLCWAVVEVPRQDECMRLPWLSAGERPPPAVFGLHRCWHVPLTAL